MAFLSQASNLKVDDVRIVETHISIVFLAGARALKLKRAMRNSYLDYSTPERRRAACEAELAINRRFAPCIYVGVEPVVRAPDGILHLGAVQDGSPIDWVVVMRRFRQEDQLDRVADRGALTAPLVIKLADEIARLHDQAEIRPSSGGSQGLARAVDITADNLRSEAARAFDAGEVADWIARARVLLRALGSVLERRRSGGGVRACHGDLHLRNICLLDGVPTAFDAIEFDDDLSSVDVLYDLAFVLMDLHARGLEDAANLLLNRYLDMRDETDGLAALPLFLSVRSAIRAQVSAAGARRMHDEGRVRPMLDEAVHYLRIARNLLDPGEVRLVAIGGLSGTGKSTLAYALAPRLGSPPGARVLRSDVLRKRAAGLRPEAPLPASAYTAEEHDATYRRLLAAAHACLVGGRTVILDAVFNTETERSAAEAVAQARGVRFDGIWLEAPIGTLLQRLEARRADASDATGIVVQAQVAAQELPPTSWCRIDAGQAAEQAQRDAEGALTQT